MLLFCKPVQFSSKLNSKAQTRPKPRQNQIFKSNFFIKVVGSALVKVVLKTLGYYKITKYRVRGAVSDWFKKTNAVFHHFQTNQFLVVKVPTKRFGAKKNFSF